MNVSSVFFHTAKKNMDRIAVEGGSAQLTYSQLVTLVTEQSGKIDRLIDVGGTVITYLSPEVDLVVTLLSIAQSNCLFSPVDPYMHGQRQRDVFEQVKPALVITRYKWLAAIDQIAKDLQCRFDVYVIDGEVESAKQKCYGNLNYARELECVKASVAKHINVACFNIGSIVRNIKHHVVNDLENIGLSFSASQGVIVKKL